MNGSTKVAEVEAGPKAQESNAGNIDSLTEVIQRNPSDPVAYNTRGVVYAKLGRYSNAVDDFSHAIALDPHFAGAYTNRALAYRQQKQDDLAMAGLQPGDRRQPERRGGLPRARQPRAGARQLRRGAHRSQSRRSGSIRKARRPITRAASSISARATRLRRSPISTTPSTATRSRARPIRRAGRVFSRPTSGRRRSTTSTPRSTSTTTIPTPGRASASPTRSSATAPRRPRPISSAASLNPGNADARAGLARVSAG